MELEYNPGSWLRASPTPADFASKWLYHLGEQMKSSHFGGWGSLFWVKEERPIGWQGRDLWVLGRPEVITFAHSWSRWGKVASGWRLRVQFLTWLLLEQKRTANKKDCAVWGWAVPGSEGQMRCARLWLVALQEECCLHCSTGFLVSDRSTPQSRYGVYNHGVVPILLSSFPAASNQSPNSAKSVLIFFRSTSLSLAPQLSPSLPYLFMRLA